MTILIRIAVLLALGSFSAAGQTYVVVTGRITDAAGGKALQGVAVRSLSRGKALMSGVKGFYSITVPANTQIEFFLLGYAPVTKQAGATDSLKLNVALLRKAYELPSVDISSKTKVDTVIGNWRYFIEDYEFYDKGFVLLTWEKRLTKSKVMLADSARKIISSVPVIGEAQNLYKDFLGRVYVICREGAQRVTVGPNNVLSLSPIKDDDFKVTIEPCIDTIGQNIYFSTYRRELPRFDYYAYDTRADTFRMVSHISDEPLERMYNFEYEFLKPSEKVLARKMARDYHMDKRDVAAAMTGFAQTHYFTPLYAPLFVVRDTVLVFNHYRNMLYKYSSDNRLVDSVRVDYHHPKNWREWKHKLIKDEGLGTVYALFQKDGFYYLKRIDTASGKVLATFPLSFPYLDRIRIRNGFVYYVYRPFESLQTKYLYREFLPAN